MTDSRTPNMATGQSGDRSRRRGELPGPDGRSDPSDEGLMDLGQHPGLPEQLSDAWIVLATGQFGESGDSRLPSAPLRRLRARLHRAKRHPWPSVRGTSAGMPPSTRRRPSPSTWSAGIGTSSKNS